MIAGTPCYVGMFRTFTPEGEDASIEWFVFFDEDEGKTTLQAMAEAATGSCMVALNSGTMFLPTKTH